MDPQSNTIWGFSTHDVATMLTNRNVNSNSLVEFDRDE